MFINAIETKFLMIHTVAQYVIPEFYRTFGKNDSCVAASLWWALARLSAGTCIASGIMAFINDILVNDINDLN